MRLRIILIAAALAGCPTGAVQSPGGPQAYLTTPFYQFTTDNTLCSLLYAVDGNNQGWQEQSCGATTSGFLQTHTLTAAQTAEIAAAFAALPAQQDPSCLQAHSSDNTVTTLRRSTGLDGGTDVSWIACVNVADGLTQPYATAVATLRDLVESPLVQDP